MIKNQLFPYIEKYINEYLFGFTKEQLNIGLTNGSIILEKLFIRPDTTNEKLDAFDIPIWLKVGTIKNIHIGCSLMNFIGDNPLEVEINDLELIICPSFKYVVKNLNSFIFEKENHFLEPYDATDNNSHEIFGQKVNLCDGNKNKKNEEIHKIFDENIDSSKFANIFNLIYSKALKFYYQKNYLIKFKIKNSSIRFEDDFFNYYGKSILGIRIPLIELSLSVDGIMKRNNFKAENICVYYEKDSIITLSSKFFLSNLNEEGKFDLDKYFEIVKTKKLSIDNKKEINILNSFSCMGSFGIKTMDKEKLDFFSKNISKKYGFFIQLATNEIQLNLNPDFLNKVESFEEFVRSFYINELIQYFKPMRKPYLKTSDLVKKYSKDSRILRKRRLVVRDWFYFMIWYTRIKKAVYGSYFKNAIQEEFSKFYNIGLSNNSEDNPLDNAHNNLNNVNDSMNLKREKKTKVKETATNLNPDNIILTLDIETLIKGLNLQLHSEKDNLNLKITTLKNSIKIDKEKAQINFNFNDLFIYPSDNILIDKSIDEKLYQKNEKGNTFSNENTDVCSKNNDDENDFLTKSKQNKNLRRTSSKDISNSNYNSVETSTNPRLHLLNEALDQLGSSQNPNLKNVDIINKNKTNINRSGNVLKVILGNVGDKDEKNQQTKEKKNKEFSEMINEFNKSYVKKNNSSIKNPVNFKLNNLNGNSNNNINPIVISDKSNNKVLMNLNKKIPLNLLEIQSGENTNHAFSFSFTKKLETKDKVCDIVNTNIGFIRINYVHDYLVNSLNILLPFKQILKKFTNKLKQVVKIDLKTEKILYFMRKYMFDKMTKLHSTDSVRKFQKYLKFNIDLIDNGEEYINQGQGHFTVNYVSNILIKKLYDMTLSISDIHVLGFENKPKEDIISTCNNTSKVKFPKVNFKIFFSKEKIYLNIFDFEFHNQNTSMLASIIKDVVNILSTSYTAQLNLVNPTIKKLQLLYEKMEKEKRIKENLERELKKPIIKDDIQFFNHNLNKLPNRNGVFDLGKKNHNLFKDPSTNKNVLKVLLDNNIACNQFSGKRISDNSFKSSISEIGSMDDLDIPIKMIHNEKKNFIQNKSSLNDFSDNIKHENDIEEESLEIYKITPKIYQEI